MFQKTLLVSSLAALSLATGCGTPEEGLEALTQEPVSQLSSALCTDSGAVNYSSTLTLGDVGGSVYSTSPSASYGSSLCLGHYVVEATNTLGKPNLSAAAEFADVGLSQANCGSGRVAALFYGWSSATNSWSQLGSEKLGVGQWVPSPFGAGGSCQVAAVSAVSNTFSKVRVAAKAYIQTASGATTKKVSVNISAHY